MFSTYTRFAAQINVGGKKGTFVPFERQYYQEVPDKC